MKRTGKRGRRSGRSPGKKERRKRAAKALAAAGAIAGGTQAYALPVRFDNPPHGEPGHFDWNETGAEWTRWLDVTLSAEIQPPGPAPVVPPAIGQQDEAISPYGKIKVNMQDVAAVQTEGYYPVVVGVSAGELIPSGAAWYPNGCADRYGAGTPEGIPTYLGVRFDLGSGYQYGWIGVVRTGTRFDTFAWGHETEPGVPIPAGALSQGACFGPEGCVECTEAECEKDGGRYMGDGITCEAAVPTVSEWGLAIMALALLAAGTWVVKKRVPQPQPSEA